MIVLGLGGNIGTEATIRGRFTRARDALAAIGDVRSAPLYRSAPIGPVQPAFLNSALRLAPAGDLEPAALAAIIYELEALLGRDRRHATRWGPRTLDLDVLVWGARMIRTPELTVPHPRLHARRFALQPLVDLVGADSEIPGVGRAGEALARVRDQQLALVSERW